MPSENDPEIRRRARPADTTFIRRRLAAHQTLFLLVLLVAIVPALGWAAWLLATVAGETVPRSASLAGVLLEQLEQLPGWAAVAGLNLTAMYLCPGARRTVPRWLIAVPSALLLAGLIVFYGALAQSDIAGSQAWAQTTASAYLLLAALLTAGLVFWLLWSRPAGIELAHLFLIVAVEWLLVFASADLFFQIHVLEHTPITPAVRLKLFELLDLGALANLVFGIGLRTWPGLFGIERLRPRAWLLTLVVYNLGLILLVMGVSYLDLVGGVLMLAGAVLFLAGLGFLRGRPGGYGATGRGATKCAVFWLLAGLVLLVVFVAVRGPSPAMGYDAFAQAIGHALTAGFFGLILAGMGVRLMGAYLPAKLVPRKLLTTLVWSFALATLAREAATIGTVSAVGDFLGYSVNGTALGAGLFYTMSACAAVQCAAMALLALAVLRTILAARRADRTELTAASRLSDVIAKQPALEPLLATASIPRTDADKWTLGSLALILGRSPEEILSDRRRQA